MSKDGEMEIAESTDSVHSLQSLLSAMRTRQVGCRDVYVHPAFAGMAIEPRKWRTEFSEQFKPRFTFPRRATLMLLSIAGACGYFVLPSACRSGLLSTS